MSPNTARLLIACQDAKGIVAAVAACIAQYEGNIVEADQHVDRDDGTFFMRVEIELDGFRLTPETFAGAWQPFAERFGMRWSIHWGNLKKKMVVFSSKQDHCLTDLLWRWKSGEFRVDIPLVISNHPDSGDLVRSCGIDFVHIPNTPDRKSDAEAETHRLLEQHQPDFLVLARYMQVLSPNFVKSYPDRIINIHHSFLPAFAGPRPYHQAFERGVKIIGATSHFVTDDLDEGPIIAQEVMHVDHRDDVRDLIRKGRDLERLVLAEAVRLQLEDKVLVSNNKTIVFD